MKHDEAVVEIVVLAIDAACVSTERAAERVLDHLAEAGYVVIKDEPDHFVTFDEDGWFVEHSVACRVAGTLGTCPYGKAIRVVTEDTYPDPDDIGRWRITGLDSEGLPSLERSAEKVTEPNES